MVGHFLSLLNHSCSLLILSQFACCLYIAIERAPSEVTMTFISRDIVIEPPSALLNTAGNYLLSEVVLLRLLLTPWSSG